MLAERMLAALDAPVTIDGHSLRISASIGIGLFPDHATSPDQLRQIADQALYRAKAAGPARFQLWAPSLAPLMPRAVAG
jgi:GGDEF domain-containing protein